MHLSQNKFSCVGPGMRRGASQDCKNLLPNAPANELTAIPMDRDKVPLQKLEGPVSAG